MDMKTIEEEIENIIGPLKEKYNMNFLPYFDWYYDENKSFKFIFNWDDEDTEIDPNDFLDVGPAGLDYKKEIEIFAEIMELTENYSYVGLKLDERNLESQILVYYAFHDAEVFDYLVDHHRSETFDDFKNSVLLKQMFSSSYIREEDVEELKLHFEDYIKDKFAPVKKAIDDRLNLFVKELFNQTEKLICVGTKLDTLKKAM